MSLLPSGILPDSVPSIKVILVGNSGVGKTCLVSACQKQRFTAHTESTVAPSFICKTIQRSDGATSVLQIWDTAGQERFCSISQLFFREARVALLCFDPSDAASVASIHDWVKRVQTEVPACLLFGVMTKSDQYETPEALDAAFESGKAELGGIGIDRWFVTSSLSDDGVDALFQAVAEQKFDGLEVRPKEQLQDAPGKSKCC